MAGIGRRGRRGGGGGGTSTEGVSLVGGDAIRANEAGKPAADGGGDGHAREGAEAGRSPRGLLQEGARDRVATQGGEAGEEAMRARPKGPPRGDGEDDEAEARLPGSRRRGHLLAGAKVDGRPVRFITPNL